MSESYSKLDFMNTLPTSNGWEKLNASPTGLTIEQIELGTYGHAYIPELIKRRRERFTDRHARHEVMCSDALATFICERWIEEITAKPFKTYDDDEEEGQVEIMQDLWQRIEQLNINEIYRAIYPKFSGDGYCIGNLYTTPGGTPGYNTFGYFESPPDYWKRYNMKGTPYHNVIYEYYVQYIPIPNGYQYMSNYNIHAEEYWLFPQQPGFFHFTRNKWNAGIGRPRLQGIWASATKLRKMSYADYRRALVFNIFEYPEDWDADKGIEEMIEAVRRADEVEGIGVPMRVNPITQQVEEFPRFRERTWDEQGGAPRSDPSAGGSLLRHSEYARVLISLGYTETKLVGSQPGEVTGSKLDLTRDDAVDIREFNLFQPVIKEINLWLLENGFLEGLEPDTIERVMAMDYDVKCSIEWEVLENQMLAAEMAEDQAEMDGRDQDGGNRMNTFAQAIIYSCLRENVNSPGMIPVQSSWIEQVGVKDKTLWFKIKGWDKGPYAGFQFKDNPTAWNQYLSATEGSTTKWGESGSTGAWIWENIWEEGTTPFSKGPRPTQEGINDDITGIHYSKDPFGDDVQYQDRGLGDFETKQRELMYGVGELEGTEGTGSRMTHTGQTFQSPLNETQPAGYFDYQMSPQVGGIPENKPDWSAAKSKAGMPGRKRKPGRKGKGSSTVGYEWEVLPSGYTSAVPAIRNVSFSTANSMMKEVRGKGMSKTTWNEFKKFLEKWEEDHVQRINSLDIGNPMHFDIGLKYAANNTEGFVEEFVCKRDWKKINNHEGNLYVYPDLGHGGKPVIVGKYKYAWNEAKDMPEITRDINDERLKNVLEKWKKTDSVIYDRLNKGLPQRMSTEYYCSVIKHNNKRYQVNFHDGDGNPYLKGIAIVNYGNCQEPFCNFENLEEN